jgi:hypothetical protein
MDKNRTARVVQVVAGVSGISSAIAFAWGHKPIGAAAAALTVALMLLVARRLYR